MRQVGYYQEYIIYIRYLTFYFLRHVSAMTEPSSGRWNSRQYIYIYISEYIFPFKNVTRVSLHIALTTENVHTYIKYSPLNCISLMMAQTQPKHVGDSRIGNDTVYILFIIIIRGILILFIYIYIYIYIYITRLASNEIFSPSNKIHREVGRAKDLSALLYILPIVVAARSKACVFGRLPAGIFWFEFPCGH